MVGNAGTLGLGPYRFPSVAVDAYGVYTNNPPCGAMRGFGCVQAAFAHEAQMDELADAVGVDPVEIRQRNGMREGDLNITGQVIDSAAPVAELLQIVADLPLPRAARRRATPTCAACPAAVGNTTHGEGVVRGVGYAVGLKNVGFSEGFDDYSTARVRLEMTGGEAVATVHTAAAEVGQGLITVAAADLPHRARASSGSSSHPTDTTVGSGGLDVGVAADLRDRRRGEGRLRGGARGRAGAGRRWRSAAPAGGPAAGRREDRRRRPARC